MCAYKDKSLRLLLLIVVVVVDLLFQQAFVGKNNIQIYLDYV